MRITGALAFGLVAFACGRGERIAGDEAGLLTASWAGQDSGAFTAPARGTWCASDSLLQVFAARGDTGVGFALYVTDTITPAQHPVISPSVVVDWRPLGAAALRWFGTSQIEGWEGTGGVISVTAVDSGPTGTLDVRLKKLGSADTLRLTGTFSRIPIAPAESLCGRTNKSRPG